MLLNGVSNLAMLLNTQDSLRQSSQDLQAAQTELSTGRYNDVNLTLGTNVSRNLNWRLALSDTSQFIDSNTQAANKANATQSSLQSIVTSANSFLSTLTGARGAVNGQSLITDASDLQMQTFQQAVNVSYSGQYLMGGQNTDTPPLSTYSGGSAEASFDSAFQSYFGFPKTDSQAVNITPSQMQGFLTGPFEQLFNGSSWSTNFSAASDINLKSRISSSQTVDVSANSNEQAFKDMMMAMVAVKDAGVGQLNQSTFQSVIDYATTKTADAVQEFGEIESRIGVGQQTLSQVSAQQSSIKNILQGQIQDTEGVDSTEAATRVNLLMSQLQANYAVTGKLSQLSLLQYLPVGA